MAFISHHSIIIKYSWSNILSTNSETSSPSSKICKFLIRLDEIKEEPQDQLLPSVTFFHSYNKTCTFATTASCLKGQKYQSILSVPVLWSLTTSVGSQQFPKGAEWIWNLYLTSFVRVNSYSYSAEESLQCILLKLYLTLHVSVQGSLASKKKKKGTLQTAWVWWQKQYDLLLSSVYLFLSRTLKHSLDTINTHICSPLPCYSQLLIILN